jgi:hypothetical protein
MAGAYVDVPADWTTVDTRRAGPFVTAQTFRRPDGTLFRWTSRAHRKRGRGDTRGSLLFAPHALAWWIGILFMLGSACFAIGPLPFYLEGVGSTGDAITYFVGSIFFTSAALCQLIEAGVAPRTLTRHQGHRVRRLLAIEVRRIDWWACSVQFAGTLFFNFTTARSIHPPSGLAPGKNAIWTPDWRGSICFIVASWLAYAEVGHSWFSWRPQSRGWRIAALNMVGSIAFLVSAVAAYVLPTTGEPMSLFWTNAGTFVGALCFFAGAALLLPERVRPDMIGASEDHSSQLDQSVK